MKRFLYNSINKLPNLRYVPPETNKNPHLLHEKDNFCKTVFVANSETYLYRRETVEGKENMAT
jgi:hypothetical protein